MARHFGPQHNRNGYAAMGNSRRRPHYSGMTEKAATRVSKPAKK